MRQLVQSQRSGELSLAEAPVPVHPVAGGYGPTARKPVGVASRGGAVSPKEESEGGPAATSFTARTWNT